MKTATKKQLEYTVSVLKQLVKTLKEKDTTFVIMPLWVSGTIHETLMEYELELRKYE